MHQAKTCSHKSNYNIVNVAESLSEIGDETVCDEEVNIVLMTDEYEIFFSEMETNAIIDTACTKTTSGEKWLLNFIKYLVNTALNKVQVIPSRKVFKFGDGQKVYLKYKAIIPVKIGKTNCYIQTEIVNEKILLLLSGSSLKKADTYINIKDDKVQTFDQDINVCMTTNGHYAVEILSEKVCNFDSIEHCLIFETDDDKYKKCSKPVKLH